MSGILVRDLTKSFEKIRALEDVNLHAEQGEFLVLLGPSGCGKTTTLRCIAGLEVPTSGEVFLGDRCVFSQHGGVDVPPRDRKVGFVFQNYALYPHMNVYQNVGFGLRMRNVGKDAITRRVTEALRITELEGLGERYPRELSGGQRQRVAVARIVAARPDTLLFDEPLSNVDPTLRVSLRAQLKGLHTAIGATSIYVTHDLSEAMVLADRIAVMLKGKIAQTGSAVDIYHFPETVSVAQITGDVKTNLVEGEVYRSADRMLLIPKTDPYCFIRLDEDCRVLAGQQVVFHVRPEDVQIVTPPAEDEGRLKVLAVMPRGMDALVHLRLGEHQEQVIVRGPQSELLTFKAGQEVSLRFRRGNIYSTETEHIIRSFGHGEDGHALPAPGGEAPARLTSD